MHLVTTGLKRCMASEEDLYFLGPWCLLTEEDRFRFKKSVMPSPWIDRDRYYRSCDYVEECYESMLARIGDYLNGVLGISLGPRFWRILIGPWVLHYVHIFYDRYIHLQEAFRLFPDLNTTVLSPSDFQTTVGYLDLVHLAGTDVFNLQIFSQLLEGMGRRFPEKHVMVGKPEEAAEYDRRVPWIKSMALGVMRGGEKCLRKIVGSHAKLAMCEMAFSQKKVWGLAAATSFRAMPWSVDRSWPFPLSKTQRNPLRDGLSSLRSDDEFQRILVSTFPQNFPAIYLEQFHQASESVNRRYGHVPSKVMSSIGWYDHEPLKFLLATLAHQGGSLIAVQHGGGYGFYRCIPVERHELLISDSYWVWGWADRAPLCNMPSPTLGLAGSRLVRRNRSSTRSRVLFITASFPRYQFRFHSQPTGGQQEDYLESQRQFLGALPLNLRNQIMLRPYSRAYGRQLRQRVLSDFSGILFDEGPRWETAYTGARMVVIDHPGTTFLETLSLNVPTVLFWDPQRWEVRGEALPYFEKLKKAGILWDNPLKAAVHLEAVYDRPDLWWSREDLQQARRSFVDRFAWVRENWMILWARSLKKEIINPLTKVEGNAPPFIKRSPADCP